MKPLCLVILLALSVPGCSRFTTTGRIDRAYYKQLKQLKVAREKRRKQFMRQQSAKIPSPDAPPLLKQNVQPSAEPRE